MMAAAVFSLDEVAHGVGVRNETATIRECRVWWKAGDQAVIV